MAARTRTDAATGDRRRTPAYGSPSTPAEPRATPAAPPVISMVWAGARSSPSHKQSRESADSGSAGRSTIWQRDPKELGQRAAYQPNGLPPIPCRPTVRTSISGHAAGRMEAGDIPARRANSALLRAVPAPHLLSLRLSRKTLRQHRDRIWVLGGRDHQPVADGPQPSAAGRQLGHTRHSSATTGGRCSPMASQKPEQRSFDATCRKLYHFLTDLAISSRDHALRHSGNDRTGRVIDGMKAKLSAARVAVKPRSRAAVHRRCRA